jgi:hypothetical protein
MHYTHSVSKKKELILLTCWILLVVIIGLIEVCLLPRNASSDKDDLDKIESNIRKETIFVDLTKNNNGRK